MKVVQKIESRWLLVLCMACCTGFSLNSQPPGRYVVVNSTNPAGTTFQTLEELFGNGQGDVSIGLGCILSYLQFPPETIEQRLRNYLRLSVDYGIPLVIQIDGENWWGDRPDLWNWWDPEMPGFNPENRYNVEWYDWSPDSAVKICWRNWGRQLRVKPKPNLMSPEYREACHREMSKIIPIIVEWWQKLPPDQKHLFIGLKLGWESSIGLNSWYYPNGNELLDQPEENDPTYGLNTQLIPSRGVQTIGYAAVKTAGLATEGPMTGALQTEVVRRHLEDLCRMAWKLGIPRDHLFTHAGGWKEGELLYSSALNRYSCPGWSFYKYARDVSLDTTAMYYLSLSDAPYWGAVEYLLQGDQSAEAWYQAMKNAADSDRFRYLNIYNWKGIKDDEHAIAAIRRIIDESK